ncbi:MAG: hypothetical protein HZA10_10400 [Nitrospirae bacterium]|nr:hypothetical protein [Nitrospirota bacterium]
MKRFLVLAVLVLSLAVTAFGYNAYAAGEGILTGKVTETMNSSGYTYVRIEQANSEKIWVAVPETKVTKGKTISFEPGAVMTNFKSKTLNRTFDKIIFSSGVSQPAQPSQPKAKSGKK